MRVFGLLKSPFSSQKILYQMQSVGRGVIIVNESTTGGGALCFFVAFVSSVSFIHSHCFDLEAAIKRPNGICGKLDT